MRKYALGLLTAWPLLSLIGVALAGSECPERPAALGKRDACELAEMSCDIAELAMYEAKDLADGWRAACVEEGATSQDLADGDALMALGDTEAAYASPYADLADTAREMANDYWEWAEEEGCTSDGILYVYAADYYNGAAPNYEAAEIFFSQAEGYYQSAAEEFENLYYWLIE